MPAADQSLFGGKGFPAGKTDLFPAGWEKNF
jgi:hypothetical protein